MLKTISWPMKRRRMLFISGPLVSFVSCPAISWGIKVKVANLPLLLIPSLSTCWNNALATYPRIWDQWALSPELWRSDGNYFKSSPLRDVSIPGYIFHDHLVPENQALSIWFSVSKWAIWWSALGYLQAEFREYVSISGLFLLPLFFSFFY